MPQTRALPEVFNVQAPASYVSAGVACVMCAQFGDADGCPLGIRGSTDSDLGCMLLLHLSVGLPTGWVLPHAADHLLLSLCGEWARDAQQSEVGGVS